MTTPRLADPCSRTRLEIFAAVFFLFNLVFLLFRFYHIYLFGEAWPIANPLFDSSVRFLDFYEINRAIYGFNPYISGLTNYPPLILILALPFAFVTDYSRFDSYGAMLGADDPAMKESVMAFVVTSYICILAAIIIGLLIKKRKKSLSDFMSGFILYALFAVSTPVLFAIDRGNYLLFTTVFLVLWAVFEEERPDSIWGAIFLGLAAATKIYPVYMLMIYLFARQWKKLAASVITGLVTTIVPIFFFEGSFYDNCRFFYHAVLDFGGGDKGYRPYYNVGITGLVCYLYRMNGIDPDNAVVKISWFAAGVVLTLLVAFIFVFEKIAWKKVLAVTALMVFLTPNSSLYNSCYLIAPIVIMIFGDNEFKLSDMPYLIVTALLMVPFAYTYLPNVEYNGFYWNMNTAILVDGLLYLAMILYYIVTGMITVIRRLSSNAIKKPA